MGSNRRLPYALVALGAVSLLSGCGALLTAGVAGGVFALGGNGGSGGTGGPSRVNSAFVTGNTSSGTVTLDFTVSNPASRATLVEVRYAVTPQGGPEDDAARPFPTRAFVAPVPPATPDPAGLATAAAGSLPNDSSVTTTPAGTAYVFQWDAAQDLRAFLYSGIVRLQILLDGQVGFTLAPFTVDNTSAPQIVSVQLPGLPPGATDYADVPPTNSGAISIPLVVAQADSSFVALTVRYSTDGGVTFPATNVASGQLVDQASMTVVPIDSVATTAVGKPYVFRFNSVATGLGLLGPQQNIAVQFTPSDTKTGPSRATPVFSVDNATFGISLGTPSGSTISDTVILGYLLTDVAGQVLSLKFEYSTTGPGGPWATCTELVQPPSLGLLVPASAFGMPGQFLWNAYQDLVVASGTPAASNVVVRVTVTRPTTQVTLNPVLTRAFSVDERLVYTIFNKKAGVVDNLPANRAQLLVPEGVAVLNDKLYVSDIATSRVRVVPMGPTTILPGGNIGTFFGGGGSTQDGTLATDFALLLPGALASDPFPPGALFVCGAVDTGNVLEFRLFRVDGSTPIVTSLAGVGGGELPYAVCFEPATPAVYYATLRGSPTHAEIWTVSPNGGTANPIAGNTGGTSTADGPLATALLAPQALAANFNIYPNVIFFTDKNNARVRAMNPTGTDASFGALVVKAGEVVTVPTGTVVLEQPSGISIEGLGEVDVTDVSTNAVYRLDGTTAWTIAGGNGGGFGGDSSLPTKLLDARKATFLAPDYVAGDLQGQGLSSKYPSKGLLVADTGNGRVRAIFDTPPAPVTTVVVTFAGTTRDMGDGLPCKIAQLDHPAAILSSASNLIVADTFVSRIRSISTTADLGSGTTLIATVAGNGNSGLDLDAVGNALSGVNAQQATTGSPSGLVSDGKGSIYFSQINEQVIRAISPGANGAVINMVAGVPLQHVTAAPATSPTPIANQPLYYPRSLAFTNGCLVLAIFDQVWAINVSGATQTVAMVSVPAGMMARVAGGGLSAPTTSPQVATACHLGQPAGVVADQAGNVYVADPGLNCILEVAKDGNLTVLAGNPTGGPGFADASGTAAVFSACVGVGLDEPDEQVLYIVDAGNDLIRAVNLTSGPLAVNGAPSMPGRGSVQTVAGTVPQGAPKVQQKGFSGDNGPALSALLDLESPFVFAANVAAVDTMKGAVSTPVLIFPDFGNSRIRYVDVNGRIRTFAGGGTLDGDATVLQPAKAPENATLTRPTALGVAPDGTYYVMDEGRIRRVTPDDSMQQRIAGTGQSISRNDGPALQACFDYRDIPNATAEVRLDVNGPRQLALSPASPTWPVPLLAIADTMGDAVRIMNLSATARATLQGGFTIAPGDVQTVPFPAGTFKHPEGVAFTSSGLIIVSDTGNDRIIAANIGTSTTVACDSLNLAAGVYAANVIASIASPTNLAIGPRPSDALLLVTVTAPNVEGPYALNLHPPGGGGINAYGGTIAQGAGVVFIGTTGFYFQDARGAALDPMTGDFLFCQRGTSGGQTKIWIVPNATGGPVGFADDRGAAGFSGDGGLATDATFRAPCAIGADSRGNFYILDAENFRVRRCRRFP